MLVLTAFFSGQVQAESALGALAALGVAPADISVFPKPSAHARDVGLRAGSKTAEGIALGAVAGSVLGALLGYVVAAGALIVPISGSVFTGPLVSALAFAGLGSVLGIVVGSLIGARFPELEARLGHGAVTVSGALVAVRCSSASAAMITQALEQRGVSFVYKSSARS